MIRQHFSLLVRAYVIVARAQLPVQAGETVLFDNTETTDGGVLTADAENWYATMFTTDSSDAASLTATLLLGESKARAAQLDLFSDEDGLLPSEFIASFESPTSYSEAVTETDFKLSGVELAADTNYWLVLRSEDGGYDWSFREDWETDDDLHPWAESVDAGDFWFPNDVFPFRFSIVSSDEVATTTCSPANSLGGDLDGNGTVEFADFLALSANFGSTTSSYSDGDIDCSGTVEFADFLALSQNFGPSELPLPLHLFRSRHRQSRLGWRWFVSSHFAVDVRSFVSRPDRGRNRRQSFANAGDFCAASERIHQVLVASDAPAIAAFARSGLPEIATHSTLTTTIRNNQGTKSDQRISTQPFSCHDCRSRHVTDWKNSSG